MVRGALCGGGVVRGEPKRRERYTVLAQGGSKGGKRLVRRSAITIVVKAAGPTRSGQLATHDFRALCASFIAGTLEALTAP